MSTAGSIQTSRESRARRTLESASIGPTPHRLAVVRALQTTPSPAGAREVFLAARKTSPMDRVTAYRILALLEKRGVVERVASGEGRYRYCLNPGGRHCHFRCSGCGRVVCLGPFEAVGLERELRQRLCVGVDRIEIRVEGTCRKCSGAEGDKAHQPTVD